MSIKNILRPSLLKKFLIAFLAVAVIPLIISEYFTLRKAEEELKSQLNEQYYLVIDQLRRTVDEIYIHSWISNLSALSVSIEYERGLSPETRNSLMDARLNQIDELILLSLKIPYLSQPIYLMKNEMINELFLKDGETVKNLFEFADAGNIHETERVVKEPIYLEASQKYFLPIEFPVNWENGETATLRGVFDIDAILNFITNEISIGHRELYMVTKEGKIIFKSKQAKFDIGTVLPYSIVENVKKSLEGESRVFQIETFNYDNKKYLGNFAISQYTNWGIVVIDKYSMAYALVNQVKHDIVFWIGLAIILCIIFSIFFAKSFSSSISYLADVSKEIGSGNLDVKVKVPSKDEIGQLAGSLQEMAISLKEAVRVREELVTIQQEVKIASRIQQSILPKGSPELPGLGFDARYIPMAGVAGDFYDFHVLDKNKLGVLVADVSGHGIPAALISSMVKIAFSLQKSTANNPAEVLRGMNQTLSDKTEDQFLTASYVYFNLEKNKLIIADAGHPPMLIWRKSEQKMYKIKPKGMIIGYMAGITFPTQEVDIKPDDRIILYTDGIIEAHNPSGEQFEEDRFEELIKNNQNFPPDKFINKVVESLEEWVKNEEGFEDDVTIIVMDVLKK